jgi:hypothetical protein
LLNKGAITPAISDRICKASGFKATLLKVKKLQKLKAPYTEATVVVAPKNSPKNENKQKDKEFSVLGKRKESEKLAGGKGYKPQNNLNKWLKSSSAKSVTQDQQKVHEVNAFADKQPGENKEQN